MKPVFAQILEIADQKIFMTKEIVRPSFATEFHFHEECQLVYVMESEGTRIIGDSIEPFTSGEIVLVGTNTPHVWHNTATYIKKDKVRGDEHPRKTAKSLVLYFSPARLHTLLGQFGYFPELDAKLAAATRGMIFQGDTRKKMISLLTELQKQDSLDRIVNFFKLLDIISQTQEYNLLSSPRYINNYVKKDGERMDRVFRYILDNFTKDVQLDAVSELAHMNKQAFCRYFKSRTQKTLIEFINHMRISHACREMEERDLPIATLAYECGFNSLSNFNRFFKEVKGITPREYKRKLAVELDL